MQRVECFIDGGCFKGAWVANDAAPKVGYHHPIIKLFGFDAACSPYKATKHKDHRDSYIIRGALHPERSVFNEFT